MKNSKKNLMEQPSILQLEQEVSRERYKNRYKKVLRSTVYTLVTVAAMAILAATLWLPVLRIYGSSMTPTLNEGELVLSVKGGEIHTGDIIAFYYNNKILVKRVISGPGNWIDIAEDGKVFVNNEPIEEPYITNKALGDCNIELPYQVPDGRYFVMGDHRNVSVDSRNTSIGCISEEQIVGKLVFQIWPLKVFGFID